MGVVVRRYRYPHNNYYLSLLDLYYRIYSRGFFADLYFRELLMGANFAGNIFAIKPKPDHTHVGALREKGVAPKISQKYFFATIIIAEIREIRENKCPRKKPTIR